MDDNAIEIGVLDLCWFQQEIENILSVWIIARHFKHFPSCRYSEKRNLKIVICKNISLLQGTDAKL